MNRDVRLFAYGAPAVFFPIRATPRQSPAYARHSARHVAPARAKNIKIECWIVYELHPRRIAAENDLSRPPREGRLTPVIHATDGFERLPEAVIGMYAAPGTGKVQVRFEQAVP